MIPLPCGVECSTRMAYIRGLETQFTARHPVDPVQTYLDRAHLQLCAACGRRSLAHCPTGFCRFNVVRYRWVGAAFHGWVDKPRARSGWRHAVHVGLVKPSGATGTCSRECSRPVIAARIRTGFNTAGSPGVGAYHARPPRGCRGHTAVPGLSSDVAAQRTLVFVSSPDPASSGLPRRESPEHPISSSRP